MRIVKFQARGYRSLREVELDGLGDRVVFYGPNGSGKSNLLEAIHVLFGLMPIAVDTAFGTEDERLSFREGGRLATEWIQPDDFFARGAREPIELSATLDGGDTAFGGAHWRGQAVRQVEVSLRFALMREGQFNLQFTRLRLDGKNPGLPFADPDVRAILAELVPQAFSHLGVSRTLSANVGAERRARSAGTIPDGELIQELFKAKNAREPEVRQRFEACRRFLADVLGRGPFDVFLDSATGRLELREVMQPPNPLGTDLPLSHLGHGVVQVYAIVATILLAGARLVAIEEPEAHLHAPTTGRTLRQVLARLVADHTIDQLFIATHSNLFDLDPAGYWDVSLVEGETRVVRRPLDDVDRLHLFEPGPAKHQLQEILRLYGDELVFRTADGRSIQAEEMLGLLQADDAVALDYLRTLHAAAMQVTGLKAKRKGAV